MEFKKYPHIEIGTTSKLFFKKYPYKVVFLGQQVTNVAYKKVYKGQVLEWIKEQFPESKRIYGWNGSIRTGTGFRTHFTGFVDMIYFVDEKHVKDFVKTFFKIVTWVDSPLNQQQIDEQLEDASIVVRKSLFNREYRYRIYFPRVSYWNSDWTKQLSDHNEVDEWFESKKPSKFEHKYYTNWETSVVLLNHKKDVILVRLALAEHIKRIEVIKLVDEFEENDNGDDIVKSTTK